MQSQTHLYQYRIDQSGNWFCEGNPVSDPALLRMLSRSLVRKNAEFFIHCEGEVHPVHIEDAPLWVRYVHIELDSAGGLLKVEIELRDGRREDLDAGTLHTTAEGKLYCIATMRRFRARFGKTAYYELTRYLQEDPESGEFFFIIGGSRYVIRHSE